MSPAYSSSTGLSTPFEATDDDLIAQDLVPAIRRRTIQQFLEGKPKKEGEGPESWEAEDRNPLHRPHSSDAPAHRELIQGALQKIAGQEKVSALCRRGEKVLQWLIHKDAQLGQWADSTVEPRREPLHTPAFDQDLNRPAFSELRSNSEGSDHSQWIPTSGFHSGSTPISINPSSNGLNFITHQYYESNAPRDHPEGSFVPPHYQHLPLHPVSHPWQTSFPCDNQYFIPDLNYRFPLNRASMEEDNNLPLFAPYDPLLNLFDPSSGIAFNGGCDFSGACLPLESDLSTAPESIDTSFLEYNGLGGVYGISHSMGWE